MARSEAQKAADRKYAQKIGGKYKPFIVNLLPDEYDNISKIIAEAGMKKAEFLRWAVKELQNKGDKKMGSKNFIEGIIEEVENLSVSPDNMVMAIAKLLEIIHAHGCDDEAVKALKECGITLEIEEN